MPATSGEDTDEPGEHAGKPSVARPSVAVRNIVMRGNRIDSRDLFSLEREIVIAHGEENYRLRLTSQNKLILTK
jgi:hemin uptake protein HemP